MDAADIAKIDLFADLDEGQRARVAGLMQDVRVPSGRRLAMEGDFGYRFFVIADGTADVIIDYDKVAELGPGDFFGEIALVEAERRTAEVVATTPMHIGSMMIWDFRELLDELPDLRAKIDAAMAERLGR